MSWARPGNTVPAVAASALAQYVAVAKDFTVDGQVITAGSVGQDVAGVNQASVPSYGLAANVVIEGYSKIIMAASTGAGARVAVASTNGAVGPITGSGLATALGSALGAAGARYSIGVLQEARAAGEIGTILVDPRQVI